MEFNEYIEKKFKENLELAREEAREFFPDDDYEGEAYSSAVEWTVDEISSEVAKHFDKKWWQTQEFINKEHYE